MRTPILSLLLCTSLFGRSVIVPQEIDLQFQYSEVSSHSLSEAFLYRGSLTSDLEVTYGVRLAQTGLNLSRFDYLGQLTYRPAPQIIAAARLFHGNPLEDQTSTSQALAYVGFDVGYVAHLFVNGGYYHRWTKLTSPQLIPTFLASDINDGNFVLQLGLRLRPNDSWEARLWLGNFDSVQVYNLNNPFVQFDLALGEKLRYRFYARYQILLGFGRLDSFRLGTVLTL